MNDQLQLDYRPTSETSRLAAADNRPHRNTDRARALAALRSAGPTGLTDFELEDATGVKQTSIGKRRLELVREGLAARLLVDGRPVRRPAPSGSLADVWIAVEAGR